VREHAPVAALETARPRRRRGDGRVLRGLAPDLPTCVPQRRPPASACTDRSTLGALAVAGGAPPELRAADRALCLGRAG
jgi:hypothetical protein